MRVIVCGGRDFGHTQPEFQWGLDQLDLIHARTPITYLFHGNAPGADDMAATWGELRSKPGRWIKVFAVPAQWSKHGKAAGPKRNQAMLGNGIDFVIAFPGGKGTADMVRRARRAGVPVVAISPEGQPNPTQDGRTS